MAGSISVGHAYTKPNTRGESGVAVFQEEVPYSPHSWVIPKAIEFLRAKGFTSEADLARRYLLPMLEGVTFNDVWGDADLAGASVLDYYSPGAANTGYGFGCALDDAFFAPYKNCTNTYQVLQSNGTYLTIVGFSTHPLYGYGNAAEHAQFRYDYGKRIYLGHWGEDPHDKMAGWVIDTLFGQNDPFDGRWASGTDGIDNATSPGGQQSRFGTGQTPAMAMQDLFQNHTVPHYFCRNTLDPLFACPDEGDSPLSSLHLPTDEVVNDAPEWLDDHFNNADDIEAFEGWDGHLNAVYANWTKDAGGHCHNRSDCSAPMVVKFPTGSKEHAFFQLGWAIHLLEDNTTPVHTVHKSYITYQVHNDVESVADAVLIQPVGINPDANGESLVKNRLPALGKSDFQALYDYPPTPPDLNSDAKCTAPALPDPANYFRDTWWADSLVYVEKRADGGAGDQDRGGVAHAYTRSVAEIANKFMPYISDCINTENDRNYPSMGFFTALGLDNAIKATAGLIRQFIEDIDKTAPAVTIAQPKQTSYVHSGTITLNYPPPTDDESGVNSVTPTLDNRATVGGHGLASGQTINLLTELSLGGHTFAVGTADNAGNLSSLSVSFSIIATPRSVKDDVGQFLGSGAIKNKFLAISLLSTLEVAGDAYAKGKCGLAGIIYRAFDQELRVLSGKFIDPSAAAIMIADAQFLIAHCS